MSSLAGQPGVVAELTRELHQALKDAGLPPGSIDAIFSMLHEGSVEACLAALEIGRLRARGVSQRRVPRWCTRLRSVRRAVYHRFSMIAPIANVKVSPAAIAAFAIIAPPAR